MSDDLVKRLRDLGDHASFEPHMHHTAADRIEELIAERDQAWKRAAHAEEMWGRAEVKLAKAVGWFETIRDRAKGDDMAHTYYLDALAAIAALKGESHE